MKKFVSLFLCIVMLISAVFTIPSFAKDEPLKITVSADTHYYAAEDAGDVNATTPEDAAKEGMIENELYYHATFQGQMNHESSAIAKQMLSDFEKSDSEYLLIAGDLTCGKRASHLEFANLLRETEKRSGKEIFVICGNHDCDTDNLDRYVDVNEFMDIYQDFGFNQADSRHKDSASYAIDLSDEYRLLAIDSCIYGEDDGKIDKSTLSWIENEVNAAKQSGKKLIAMMHHSLLSHFAVQPMFKNSNKVAEQFAAWGIKVVFTGHIHANDISMATDANGNSIYDVQTGSIITSPNAYREVVFAESEIHLTSKFVESINIEDLPYGFNEKQLNAMKSDFPSYAYGYFESGVCRWLNKYVGSAGKVGKLLKLKPESDAYKALDAFMNNIGEALNLPIYDDGSTPGKLDTFEEIAALSGISIPKSDYRKLYQVAGKVMNAFYHGNEPDSLKTVELPILISCVKGVLSRTVVNIAYSSKLSKGFNDLMIQKFGFDPYNVSLHCTTKTMFALKVSDYMLESLLTTFGDGFVSDLSDPLDLDVTISGYDTTDSGVKQIELNTFKKILSMLKQWIKSFLGLVFHK